MASIATSIQIIDRVSAPINNMIVALDNMCSAYESVQDSMNTGFNTRTIDQARQAIDAAAQQVTQLGNNIEDNEEHQQNFNRTVQNGMDGGNLAAFCGNTYCVNGLFTKRTIDRLMFNV